MDGTRDKRFFLIRVLLYYAHNEVLRTVVLWGYKMLQMATS